MTDEATLKSVVVTTIHREVCKDVVGVENVHGQHEAVNDRYCATVGRTDGLISLIFAQRTVSLHWIYRKVTIRLSGTEQLRVGMQLERQPKSLPVILAVESTYPGCELAKQASIGTSHLASPRCITILLICQQLHVLFAINISSEPCQKVPQAAVSS